MYIFHDQKKINHPSTESSGILQNYKTRAKKRPGIPWKVIIGVFLFSFVSGQAQDIPSFTQDWTKPEYTQEIASVGDLQISALEFLLSYEFGPAFFKRSEQSKKKYLTVMIYEKLLALEGYRQELDKSEPVRLTCKAYAEDLMTEELFKEEIMNGIRVNVGEIDQALPLEKDQIYLRWLYSEDSNEIYGQWHKLKNGLSFDSLYTEQLAAGIDEADRSLATSRYSLKYDNPELAPIVENLPVGTTSTPIEVSDGWYIIKKVNIWTNPITTQSEEIKLRHELERSIFKQKLDSASDIYVKSIMDQENPRINKESFAEVVFYLNENAVNRTKFDQKLIEVKLGRPYQQNIQKAGSISSPAHILVKGNKYRISLNDFMQWYKPRKAYIKFNTASAVRFILTVQETVWRMVRDFLLVMQARQLGLDKREAVVEQVKWWEEKFVFNAIKVQTAASIKSSEDDLQTYYNDNISNYRNPSGQIISFEKARMNVQSDYLKEKYMNRLMHRVLALKNEYNIDINEEILEHLTVQEEENPRAIDLYTVKKGGLLPRQPYPTIDWEWQLWY